MSANAVILLSSSHPWVHLFCHSYPNPYQQGPSVANISQRWLNGEYSTTNKTNITLTTVPRLQAAWNPQLMTGYLFFQYLKVGNPRNYFSPLLTPAFLNHARLELEEL